MRVNRKIALLQTSLICFFIGVILIMLHLVWGQNYLLLEQQQVKENAARVNFAWEEELADLDALIGDWSPWDDLYNFVQNPDTNDFMEKNLTDSAMVNLKVNTATVIGTAGQIVSTKAVDLNTREETEFPEELLKHITRIATTPSLMSSNDSPISGFVVTSQGPVLLSAQKILTSAKEGQSPGMLFFGKYADTKLFRDLGRRTQVEVGFYEQRESVNFVPRGTNLYQEIAGDQYIKTYQLMRDIYGNSDYYLVASTPRTIYAQWQAQKNAFLLLILVFGALFVAITMFALNRVILARIRKMGEFMYSVTIANGVSNRLSLAGNDELSAAADAMNAMLDRLAASKREIETLYLSVQQELEDRKKAEQALRHISMHDPLTGLYNRVYFEQAVKGLASRGLQRIGVVSCDLDGLKLINDTMGHSAGDRLLIQAAHVLKSAFANGIVARIGGDEFAALLIDIDEAEVIQSCKIVREQISQLEASNMGLGLNLSLGWKYYEGPEFSEEAINNLLKQADDIMYRQKLSSSQSNRSAIVQAMLEMLRLRDFITEGHSQRLQEYVQLLGEAVGLDETVVTDLTLLAQFHDIGKVGISDSILFKDGKLSEVERQEMERHAEIGYRIAQSIPELAPIADLILKHHEWWNGQGYPLGLKGLEIPIGDRILAIADAFDAMTNDRPYRQAMSIGEALNEISGCSGTQFDPELAAKFIDIVNKLTFHNLLIDKSEREC